MKSHEADVKLGEGLEIGAVHAAHKKGITKPGNTQAAHTPTKGMSDHETLRNDSRPKVEDVKQAPHNSKVQAKAHGFNVRSEQGGAEKEGGW